MIEVGQRRLRPRDGAVVEVLDCTYTYLRVRVVETGEETVVWPTAFENWEIAGETAPPAPATQCADTRPLPFRTYMDVTTVWIGDEPEDRDIG